MSAGYWDYRGDFRCGKLKLARSPLQSLFNIKYRF
jgi:hypothetical protein